MKTSILVSVIVASICSCISYAFAQTYPNRLITLVSIAAPGSGSSDLVTRTLAKLLETQLTQKVVVENRPGAGGYIAGNYVARAAPDGYTLLVTTDATVFSHLFIKDQEELTQRLTPIGPIGTTSYIMVAPSKLQVRNLREFVNLVRANPGKFNFAGITNTTQLLESYSFLRANGLSMNEIPFSTSSGPLQGLLSDSIQLFFTPLVGMKAQIDSGALVGLATMADRRSAILSNVPTTIEQGFKTTYGITQGLFGPLNLPKEIVERVYRAMSDGLASTEGKETLARLGYEPATFSPEEMRRQIEASARRYSEVSAVVGIKPQ